jgi:hypothetical protein
MTLVEKSFFSLFTRHLSLQPLAGWPYEEGIATRKEITSKSAMTSEELRPYEEGIATQDRHLS